MIELADLKKSNTKGEFFMSKPKKNLKELEYEESERPMKVNEGTRDGGFEEIRTTSHKRRNRNLY